MFIHDHIALCVIDVSTRWWVASEIQNREEQTILDAIDTFWVSHHGPPKEFVMDSETAVYRSALVQQYFQRKGINFIPRAKKQQIPHVDRRMALQKIAIHKTIDQLKVEGIVVPFKHILSDTNFAGNCLVTVNSMSPYMALYGRVPALLPDICQANADNEHLQVAPGTIRWTYRLREIAASAMVNASAQSRVERALHASTQPSGETYNLKVGAMLSSTGISHLRISLAGTDPQKLWIVRILPEDMSLYAFAIIHLNAGGKMSDLA